MVFASKLGEIMFDEIHLLLYQIKKQGEFVGKKVVEYAHKWAEMGFATGVFSGMLCWAIFDERYQRWTIAQMIADELNSKDTMKLVQ